MVDHHTSMRMALAAIVLQMLLAAVNGQEQSSQCQTLKEQCDNSASIGTIEEVVTGKGSTTLLCHSGSLSGNRFQWYLTKTTFSEGQLLDIVGTKYSVGGFRDQFLTVKNITQNDEGMYYCLVGSSGDPVLGACLYAYSPAQFKICSGEKLPASGCSTVEEIQATTRDISVEFDISLTHDASLSSCHNQSIQTIVFRKDTSDLDIRCTDNISSCYRRGAQVQRFNVFRKSASPFDIAVSLSNISVNDSGRYSIRANLAYPGGYTVPIYKSFVVQVTAVHFEVGGSAYGNNSVVNVDSIGEGENALLCMTDREDCCRSTSNEATSLGEFFFPNGTKVPGKDGGLYRHQGNKHISLNRKEGVKFPAGKYSCEILDAGGVIQEIFIRLSDGEN